MFGDKNQVNFLNLYNDDGPQCPDQFCMERRLGLCHSQRSYGCHHIHIYNKDWICLLYECSYWPGDPANRNLNPGESTLSLDSPLSKYFLTSSNKIYPGILSISSKQEGVRVVTEA